MLEGSATGSLTHGVWLSLSTQARLSYLSRGQEPIAGLMRLSLLALGSTQGQGPIARQVYGYLLPFAEIRKPDVRVCSG